MTDNLRAFIEYVSTQDDETRKEVAALEADALIAYAADRGFALTEADLTRDDDDEGEISLDEAEAVAGGDACFCVVGGGGVARESDDTYAFVAAGAGMDHGGQARSRSTRARP